MTAVQSVQRPARPRSLAAPGATSARGLADAALVVLGLVFLVPLLWLVFASFDTRATLVAGLPEAPGLGNFTEVISWDRLGRPLLNSTVLSAGAAAVATLVATLTAYPLSRYRLRFGRGFMYAVLFGTCLPITAMMVPVYALFVKLEWLDSLLASTLFLAATSLPMAIFMTKNFMDSVPVSLEEAAWTDGAKGPVRSAR